MPNVYERGTLIKAYNQVRPLSYHAKRMVMPGTRHELKVTPLDDKGKVVNDDDESGQHTGRALLTFG